MARRTGGRAAAQDVARDRDVPAGVARHRGRAGGDPSGLAQDGPHGGPRAVFHRCIRCVHVGQAHRSGSPGQLAVSTRQQRLVEAAEPIEVRASDEYVGGGRVALGHVSVLRQRVPNLELLCGRGFGRGRDDDSATHDTIGATLEGAHSLSYPLRARAAVGVGEGQHLGRGRGGSQVPRRVRAGLRLVHDSAPRSVDGDGGNLVVVDEDDVEQLGGVVLRGEGVDQLGQPVDVAVHGHDSGDRGRPGLSRGGRRHAVADSESRGPGSPCRRRFRTTQLRASSARGPSLAVAPRSVVGTSAKGLDSSRRCHPLGRSSNRSAARSRTESLRVAVWLRLRARSRADRWAVGSGRWPSCSHPAEPTGEVHREQAPHQRSAVRVGQGHQPLRVEQGPYRLDLFGSWQRRLAGPVVPVVSEEVDRVEGERGLTPCVELGHEDQILARSEALRISDPRADEHGSADQCERV